MSDKELRGKLEEIRREASDKTSWFVLFALTLLIMRGCR